MSKVQTLVNNEYTKLSAQLGVASFELSTAQKKVDELRAQIIALNAIAPALKAIEKETLSASDSPVVAIQDKPLASVKEKKPLDVKDKKSTEA